MRLADLAAKRVAIWGFGREGRASLKAIRSRFPHQPITVFCGEDEAVTIAADRAVVAITTSPDADALSKFDVVIKSPGISPYKPPYIQAEAAGVRFRSGSALWFAEHPDARALCITGTKGKSTVAALIAHLLRKSGKCIALAGNIGVPLLELLDPPREPDWWVIELSSFQTRDFDGEPTIAVITNLYEEHLDWHGSAERYFADKLKVAAHAKEIVIAAQRELIDATAWHSNVTVFDDPAGWHVANDAIYRGDQRIIETTQIALPGLHNAHNVCAALAAVEAAGENAIELALHVASFKPLPHRLQRLGERDGRWFVNDSISTTPYASVEALRSLGDAETAILVGGFDRGVSWRIFVDYVAKHPPQAIVTMGANGPAIARELRCIPNAHFVLVEVSSLADAVARAREATHDGATILLSPGAPSFDQFRDYAQRGQEFARLAGFDPSPVLRIEGMGIA